ncbi:DUF2909 domain-containing protein [Curvibacter sp. APW13]|uniref:DUF2909 domain-containing protein n=1 Tax=Curvibacter sp. APW13 TaxID=3077236 RepID=UPI0028DE6E3D|nr:DUF2909 domain-containing protein [Curvibacter sp. APW13]MDT8989655.1 DUF2909 domain-containing protein [Curvibacter sp. APW13]
MLTKLLIVAVLVLIVFNLFRALAALLNKDKAKDPSAVVRALTIRVALSVGLFVALLVGAYFGIIPTHGLR